MYTPASQPQRRKKRPMTPGRESIQPGCAADVVCVGGTDGSLSSVWAWDCASGSGVVEQPVGSDAEGFGQQKNLCRLGDGIPAFPARDGLARNTKLFGQPFL